MQELKSNKKFNPPNKAKDAQGLSSLIGFLNDSRVTGAVVPKGEDVNALPVEATDAAPIIEQPATALPVSAPTVPIAGLNRIVFTGRFLSGKDFVAEQAGLKIFSFAQPIYALQALFFGTDDKRVPGAREFLQVAGQIGRNELSAKYPLCIERANFIALVREHAARLPDDFSVDWSAFGTHQNLWLDALSRRVEKYLTENPGARVGVTNARFSNELTRLTSEGFMHFHCMASAGTWTERLKRVGLTPESPAAKDVSESLAATLDTGVTKQLSSQRQGNKLRAIWSDERVAPPSNRLLTVAQFVAMFPKP